MYRFAAAPGPDERSDRFARNIAAARRTTAGRSSCRSSPRRWQTPRSLPRDIPDITFILQHAGMLEDLSAEGRDAWRDGMKRLADQPNVVSKLSGLGTFIHRNDPAHIAGSSARRSRCSAPAAASSAANFPIEKLWTGYGDLVDAHRAAVACLPDADQDAILRGTATRVYRL